MLLRCINDFMAHMPTMLPDLLSDKSMDEPAIYDDYALLNFRPVKRITTEQAANMLEEQANLCMLYLQTIDALKGWQYCCAFTYPQLLRMYKLNVYANDDGFVESVTVFLFDDLEKMRGYLRQDLKQHRAVGGMKYEMADADVIKMFL